MTDRDAESVARFRQRLESLAGELRALEESSRDAQQTVELDQSRQGRLSRMDALQGQAMSIETQRRRRLELKRIEAALRRIEVGEFGYCIECGEPIAPQRLELDPGTPLCIDCATKAENG